ncbi:helix-turn-helix domain-containing protein [Burkholderia vietnamiensis]|uniref:helix-turn-helix domain-containing protein n=1 Tax=Burkholderia vietnamiensis TaxID=60552 RepID=UPI00159413F5|nr:hypothetical protein [Burkholderia vietnamiensis]
MRIDDGLTLQQVADRLGVALVTVSKWWRDGEFDRPAPGEPDSIWHQPPHGAATAYDARRGRLVNPSALDTFVPPSQRSRATIAAAGRLTADEAAAFVGCSVPHLNRAAANAGDLPFVVIDGRRTFDRADLETWRDLPTPTGRPRRSLDSERSKAVRSGPLLSLSDAWRLLGYANRSSVTRLVESGRLPVVFDEQGRKRVNRVDVEALGAEREARKARRAGA